MFKKYTGLTAGDGRIIFEHGSEFGNIKILENEDYRWLEMGGGVIQSLIHTSKPDDVLLPYTQAMLLALAFHKQASRLLNLGSGGGVIERFFYACYPDITITSVESNADIIALSREYFNLPTDHCVLHESAELFLQRNISQYDVVFCDLHDGKGHPDFLFDAAFYESIANSLNEGAVFVINLIPGSEDVMLALLLAMRKHFSWQYLLDFENYGNIVLFLFRQKPVILNADDVFCVTLMKHLKVDLRDVIDRLILLPAVCAK